MKEVKTPKWKKNINRQDYTLLIENLSASVENKKIINNLSLYVKPGERHIVFGPNAAGKSTLAQTVMGIPTYKVTSGKIYFNNIDITNLSITERSKLGIFLTYQSPPEVRGVKLGSILKLYTDENGIQNILNITSLDLEFINRELNVGFSGGEKKKSELAQAFAVKPKLLILDEIDSGVDIGSLKLVGSELSKFLHRYKCSSITITHYGYILEYLRPDIAHVMVKGQIACSGKPEYVWDQIMKEGYKWCEECLKT